MENKLLKSSRKGQFFIIGAVIILLAIYGISSALNSNWQTDVSNVQSNEAIGIFKNLESGINNTLHASEPWNIKQNLDSFTNLEKNTLEDAYNLYIGYTIEFPNVTANVSLTSSSFYAEKSMRFERKLI